MYGYEESSTGLGGMAAQAPSNPYLASSMAIHNVANGQAGGPPASGLTLPFSGSMNNMVAAPTGSQVSSDGQSVTKPPEHMVNHWSQILDWHSNPAPWILLAILVLYGWIHLSLDGRAGRARVHAGF